VELAPDVARIAQLIGDPARAAILVALVDGRARPAGELALLGNIAPQTASFHLRKLMDASLLAVERQGKHSYYRLANGSVASTLESLAALAPFRKDVEARDRSHFDSERVKELRFARLCYTHLAGALAVDITRALLDNGFVRADPERMYSLTDRGRQWLGESDANLSGASRACIDWTERRHHLGGVLGAAVLCSLTERRWIATIRGTRSVRVTLLGVRELERQLGITIRDPRQTSR
jgi:DNA-binding transcriptional ArsR family regulator